MAKWKRRTHSHNPTVESARDFDLQRFQKLCAMLASPHEGERAAAAVKASDMLRIAGLAWSDVIKDRESPLEQVTRPKSEDGETRARRFWKSKVSPFH
jgi:hypothetical protein